MLFFLFLNGLTDLTLTSYKGGGIRKEQSDGIARSLPPQALLNDERFAYLLVKFYNLSISRENTQNTTVRLNQFILLGVHRLIPDDEANA